MTFTQPQVAGHLNVVVVGWHDSTASVSSVTDTKGNTYQLAIGPTRRTGALSQSIYYAKSIVAATASSNVVSVAFTAPAATPDVRIAEYAGVDTINPLDVAIAGNGSSTTSSSGAATTTFRSDLLIASNTVRTVTTTAAGSGYTRRPLSSSADILEDRVVTSAGSNTATATLSGSNQWVMQLVAFRALDTLAPSAPTGLTATVVSTTQINLSWTAATDDAAVTEYSVERCQGTNCTTFTAVASPTTTTFSNSGLSAGTSYSFQVRAKDAAGNLSLPSSIATAITRCTASSQCSDGNVCNGVEACDASGVCQAGTPIATSDNNACTNDLCDPITGTVTHIQVTPDDGNPCTSDACDSVAGVTHTPANEGGLCSDNNACTVQDRCHLGACTGTNVSCPSDFCHSAGTCDPATGLCTGVAVNEGADCDDGNRCTLHAQCRIGVCIPEDPVTGCTTSTDTYYAPLTNLGSRQGISVANDINNHGVVAGTDVHFPSLHEFSVSGEGIGFTWTANGGVQQLPQPPGDLVSLWAISDDGEVVGTSWDVAAAGSYVYHYDPTTNQMQGSQTGGWGMGINASGQYTGKAVFDRDGFKTYRAQGSTFTPIALPPGFVDVNARGISASGDIVGHLVRATSGQGVAMRYTDALQFEYLSQLLPAGSDWAIDPVLGTDYLAGASGTNGTQIVGSGLTANGRTRGFVLTPSPTGAPGSATIKMIGLPTNGLTPDTTSNLVIPSRINSAGQVVGTIADLSNGPQRAFMWVDGTGTTDLNDYVDPNSGWVLTSALGINDGIAGQPEVVGDGLLNGQKRAFKMRVPVLTPCPGADVCHTVGHRDPRTGGCPAPTRITTIPACQEGITLRVDGVVDMGGGQFVALFGYTNSGSAPIRPTTNAVTINGNPANPQPPPLSVFPPGDYPGIFLPTFGTTDTITWTVDGLPVSASAALSPHLPPVPIGSTGIGVRIGSTLVTLRGDLPPDPGKMPGPPVGAPYNGALAGQFSVSPSGAATYTVPISILPGIAGMAPNLALSYSSQGSDGIAGEGWSLAGLSTISRCPLTRQQDGIGRPVMLDSLTAPNPDGLSDGLCLDGQKLFEQAPAGSGKYVLESQDFSTITRTGNQFQVVTKAGETRYYGRLNNSNVQNGGQTAIWLLDRVADAWGNYFDIHYNQDQGTSPANQSNLFTASGIWVSEIDYTGTLTNSVCNSDTPPASCFFASVTFQYECRSDTRWTRLGPMKIPQSQRLKSITTPQGTYSLAYSTTATAHQGPSCPVGVAAASLNRTELISIGYCAGSTCMKSIIFGWQNPHAGWQANAAYALPSFVGTGKGLIGTQFIDLNGDGRLDFVLDRVNGISGPGRHQTETVLNTGSGWGPLLGGTAVFPIVLSDANDAPTGVRFADLDGDGRPDIIADSASVSCNVNACLACLPGACNGPTTYSPAVWLNRFNLDGTGGWQFDSTYSGLPSGVSLVFNSAVPWMVADVDGDGKADLIQPPAGTGTNGVIPVNVLISAMTAQGVHTWGALQFVLSHSSAPDLQGQPFLLQDVNRDGLIDLVRDKFYAYPDGSIAVSEDTVLNQGPDLSHNKSFRFASEARVRTAPSGGTPVDMSRAQIALADVDGEGFHDAVAYASKNTATGYFAAVGFGDGTGPAGDGIASGFAGSTPYLNILKAFSPPVGGTPGLAAVPEDYGFALIDINGDGLADLVRNHWQRTPGLLAGNPPGGGEILLGTGTTWISTQGATAWQIAVSNGTPGVVPSDATRASGSAFIDLNGDGLPDLIQEENGGSNIQPGAWINTLTRPVINNFIGGMTIQPTTVTYVSTTSGTGAATYKDDDVTEANTKPLATPVMVVASVMGEDASGAGLANTRTYTYHSLRQDSFGRGPLGFHRVEMLDQASQVKTVTTYAQAYPFTGMPTEIDKYQIVGTTPRQTNKTTNIYCYTLSSAPAAQPTCGSPAAGQFPAKTSVFKRPGSIADIAYLHPETSNLVDKTEIDTGFFFDAAGNSTMTLTTVTKKEGGTTDIYQTQVNNTYGDAAAALEGKPTRTVTQSSGGTSSTGHTTEFVYAAVNTFGGISSRVALTTKRIEPDVGWPTRLDTAYKYDQFGNVVQTTSCASDFSSCTPGATNPIATAAIDPTDPHDPIHHPPFRTATTSYDPALLGVPVSYGPGRYPTVTTNALGQFETTIYDPVLGKLVNKTGPNGIQTCFAYDALGRQTSQTERCNSTTPLTTTTQYFLTPLTGFSPPNSIIVTVTTPPTDATSWSYSDDQGKSTATLAYAFDGGFIESTTAYNALGQVKQVAKPFHLATIDDRPMPSYIVTTYDLFNRVYGVTDPLGIIDGSGVAQSALTITTYNGSTVQTDRLMNSMGAVQTRNETKNAIGKVATVTTTTETGLITISYRYDADGNLTRTTDPNGNQLQIAYDNRGRKTSTIDPDMGTWTYITDGFDDLVSQTDAKGQGIQRIYDPLDRMLSSTDSTGIAEWIYDGAPGAGKGKLAAMVSAPNTNLSGTCALPSGALVPGTPVVPRAIKSFQYTSFGDVQEVDECTDGTTFVTSYQYDALGRQSSIRYPIVNVSQLAVGYHYTSLGYLQYLTDDSSSAHSVLWQAKAMNEVGQVTDEQMLNGVETVSSRNPLTGWLRGSSAIAHGDQNRIIQDWSYEFDKVGNLLTRNRADAVNAVTSSETFTYDLTNRLLTSTTTTSGGYNHPESYVYDPLGNLTQKSGSVYTYGAGCHAGTTRTAGPHAVCTVAGGAQFAYDANGNLTSNGTRSVRYNPSNKVIHVENDPAVSQGNDSGAADFIYGADGNRVVQLVTSNSGTSRTVYVGLGATGKSLYERTTTGTTTKHVHYIYAAGTHGGAAFALRVLDGSGAVTANKYYSFDHLGSVTAMSDDQGRVSATGADATVFGYDAWGARRNPDGTVPATSFNLQIGARQFTGQEQIPNVGLVNMNGRLYDQSLGRFLSPDPHIQFAADLQSYNRYTYVGNNPLRYNDPTGYFWNQLGGFFKNYFSNPMNDIELVASLAVCAGSGGVGCMVFGLEMAMMNAAIAIGNGAGFGQTILNTSIGLGVGLATGGLGQEFGLGPWESLAMGSASAAVTTGVANVLCGKDFFQYNVLGAVVMSAAQGAATIGLTKVVAVSQASAGGTGGNGESAAVARARGQAAGQAAQEASASTSAGEFNRQLDDTLSDAFGGKEIAAARAAAQKFDLQIPSDYSIEYDQGLTKSFAYSDPGNRTIVLGRDAYESAGWLASTVGHELVHVNYQYALGNVVADPLSMMNNINEIEAFDWELQNAGRLGLTPAEVNYLQSSRAAYIIGADPYYITQSLEGNYRVMPWDRPR